MNSHSKMSLPDNIAEEIFGRLNINTASDLTDYELEAKLCYAETDDDHSSIKIVRTRGINGTVPQLVHDETVNHMKGHGEYKYRKISSEYYGDVRVRGREMIRKTRLATVVVATEVPKYYIKYTLSREIETCQSVSPADCRCVKSARHSTVIGRHYRVDATRSMPRSFSVECEWVPKTLKLVSPATITNMYTILSGYIL